MHRLWAKLVGGSQQLIAVYGNLSYSTLCKCFVRSLRNLQSNRHDSISSSEKQTSKILILSSKNTELFALTISMWKFGQEAPEPSPQTNMTHPHFVLGLCSVSCCSCQLREGLSQASSRRSNASLDTSGREDRLGVSGVGSTVYFTFNNLCQNQTRKARSPAEKMQIIHNMCLQWRDSRQKECFECAVLMLLVISWVFVILCVWKLAQSNEGNFFFGRVTVQQSYQYKYFEHLSSKSCDTLQIIDCNSI